MADLQAPLILCMENASGEEVTLRIEQDDDFQSFLTKSKSLLGFDVDINSITRNQPVSLSDNIYQFLIAAEQDSQDLTLQSYDPLLEPSNDANDLVYILDDGTQIRASQIHFDNDDPQVDLTAEKIPFVKYTDDIDDFDVENVLEEDTKKFNIVESPVSRWSSKNSSPKCSFVNSLPFKLVCNNTSVFEAQFTKYLETSTAKTYTTLNPVTNRNKSPRSLIRENYKSYDDKFNRGDDFTGYTREEVLNMFKDSPVASIPCESQNFNEKRKHVRKSDPTRAVHKSWNSKPANYDENILIGDNENQNCFICGKFVENNIEKLYLFDNEDQKLHRSSPQKKSSRQLKIICENCLGENFKPCRMKGPNQCLDSDEYLVIRNNQQYIFQKTNKIDFKCNKFINDTACINVSKETSVKHRPEKEKVEFVKVEIGSDGEIVTKPIDNDPRSSDDIIIVKDEGKESSSDVEIIETPEIDENIIDHLEDADEEVKEFLGKYQCVNTTTAELKCRFCERVFVELAEVMEHVDEHKHDHDEGVVYPCPICDYGYAKSGWLKAHLKAAHEKTVLDNIKKEELENNNNDPDEKSALASPIARRTRSSTKRADDNPEKDSKPEYDQDVEVKEEKCAPTDIIIKTEIKQEAVDSSDDEIWIVQTGDETSEQLESLLHAAKAAKEGQSEGRAKKMHKCFTCSRIFATEDSLNTHKCRRRAKKRKSPSKEDNAICVPTKEDFIKRAQGRTRPVMEQSDTSNDLLVPRTRRKKNKGPTSDPQIVTCHNCNESFTSKVRLKFHMQFHSPTNMLTADGYYKCVECVASRPTEACFPAEAALFDHIHFRHHKRRRWQCPVRGCGKTFHLRATLTKHSRTHTDTRRYKCVTCGKRFLDKQTLDEHGVTHLQIKPFQCHICLKQLTRRSRLRMHLRAHEEELTPKLVLVCGVCSRAFRDHEDAQTHAAKSSECLEEFTKELKEETEEITAQLSPTSGLVRQTMKIAESPKLSKPVPRQVAAPLARPLLASLGAAARSIIRVVEVEKAFRCEYCEDVFYLEDGLNAHRAIHKNVNNPFTCHICKVSFATYSRCTTHKTTHGFYKRPLADAKRQAWGPNAGPSATGILGYGGFPVAKHFLCEDCGRSYLHWTYLQVHRRMKHANDNFLYKCNQCDLTFPNSWSLAYHRKKIHGHSGQGEAGATSKIPREVYRIPCRDCDEVLPNKTALYKHRKKEHSDLTLRVNNKPGTSCCGSCGKQHSAECGGSSEYQNDDVQKSMDVTVPRRAHSCPVCACSFRSASVRDEHLRTHTGERPFPCDLCPLAFRRSTAMRNHRLIHTGVRAWACPRCPKRFRIRSELRTHARLKHPKHLAVIEILGLNPSPDEVMEHLAANNIAHDKVIEITKMSFPKGASSVVPSCARALAMLGNIPRTPVAYSKPLAGDNDFQPARRGRGIAKNPRRPKILQRGEETDQDGYPVALNVSNELTDADVQMMLRDGVLVDGSQMVRLQLNDSLLLE